MGGPGAPNFRYFRDPDRFAYRIDEPSTCSICDAVGVWFDAGGFSGAERIECVCDACLAEGRLADLEIRTNEAYGGTPREIDEIVHRTPSLPTWQDLVWPYVDGRFCVFERIAAKADFAGRDDFERSLCVPDRGHTDLDRLWDRLPDRRVRDRIEGNSNVCVYLFTCGSRKHCLWDAS